MAAERDPVWLAPDRLEPAQWRAVKGHLRERRPVGVVGQGERNDAFYRSLTVRSAGGFVVQDLDAWGVLESAEHGAVLVPHALAEAAELPPLPPALRRLAARVGPTGRRLRLAQEACDAKPGVRRLRERFIAAAVAHAELHRRLEAWSGEASPAE
jgi:hypothetical protein